MADNKVILRMEKLKGFKGDSALSHIRREYPMQSLTHPDAANHYVRPPESKKDMGKKFKELLEERLEPGYKYRKDAVKGFHFIMSYSPGALTDPKEIKDWAITSIKFLQKKFGADNFVEGVLHCDESSIHIHAIVTCVSNGRLKAKDFINGPEDCRRLQTDYAAEVERFGLERGTDKRITKRKHQNHRKWMADNAHNQAKLEAYEQTFGTAIDMKEQEQRAFFKALNEAFREPTEEKTTEIEETER